MTTRAIILLAACIAGAIALYSWRQKPLPSLAVDQVQVAQESGNATAQRGFQAGTQAYERVNRVADLSLADALASAEHANNATAVRLEKVWLGDRIVPPGDTVAKLQEAAASGAMATGARHQPLDLLTDCRASMCRVEGSFAPGADGNDWATRMLLDMGSAFGSVTTITLPLEGGGSQVVLYAFRSGHQPPSRL